MELQQYQAEAQETAIYDESVWITLSRMTQQQLSKVLNLHYVSLKLNGEAGELAEEVAKSLRDDFGVITLDRRQAIFKELGDVLWYIAAICEELDFDLNSVAQANIEKLRSRKEREMLHGSGSNR
jgi:NTP pyrophosphatase (non-canonical NTP hydrolase)